MLVSCNHCRNRVLPKDDDTCPSCHQTIDATASEAIAATAAQTPPPVPGLAPAPARRSFRDLMARRAKAGIVFGAVLALYGAFGGSYQRRGAGYTAGGSELMWAGALVAGSATVLFLICRRRQP